ncbi:MAG: DNA polymerase III subunit delta [Dehalococcoidia bacterium]|nr:DNA polymerase III subunit delta [Dehalococcoidia bacterium]
MLYVFFGPDTFSRREALLQLKSELDTDGGLQTNTITLDARQASAQEIIAACDTAPFLGGHRLVVVEGLLALASRGGGRRSRKKDADDEPHPMIAALLEYAPRLPESTTLLLLDDGAKPETTVIAALRAAGKVRQFALPDPKSVAGWLQQRARQMELRLEPGAVRLLAGLIGNDLWLLVNELEKLKTYAAGQTVREADVRALVSRAQEQKGYFLADAVAEGKPAAALRILHELLEDGVHPQPLLSTVAGRYRRLAIAREMLDAGASAGAVGARLGAKGFGLDRLIEQASRHSPASIRAAYQRLVQAELDTKRGVFEDKLSMELLVHDLAAAPAPAA